MVEPPPARVVDQVTTKVLQVLWTVRKGRGAWDARQIDLRLGLMDGDVEGGIMPELRYLESRGLVARTPDSAGSMWSIQWPGEALLAEYDRLPKSPSRREE